MSACNHGSKNLLYNILLALDHFIYFRLHLFELLTHSVHLHTSRIFTTILFLYDSELLCLIRYCLGNDLCHSLIKSTRNDILLI